MSEVTIPIALSRGMTRMRRPVPGGWGSGARSSSGAVGGRFGPHLDGSRLKRRLVRIGPQVATLEPVVKVELERVEALELLGMTLAHLNIAEAQADLSPRVPLLMAIRDKLALALREET